MSRGITRTMAPKGGAFGEIDALLPVCGDKASNPRRGPSLGAAVVAETVR
jgi:hypothetical protein